MQWMHENAMLCTRMPWMLYYMQECYVRHKNAMLSTKMLCYAKECYVMCKNAMLCKVC